MARQGNFQEVETNGIPKAAEEILRRHKASRRVSRSLGKLSGNPGMEPGSTEGERVATKAALGGLKFGFHNLNWLIVDWLVIKEVKKRRTRVRKRLKYS